METKKIDKTIDEICDWIRKELKDIDVLQCDRLAEITKALAELVSARAEVTNFDSQNDQY